MKKSRDQQDILNHSEGDMSIQNIMAIHPIMDDIFHSGGAPT